MRIAMMMTLDDSVPCCSGTHASFFAWEWELFSATKMQWQPGVFLPLSWQSLCFLIQLDAIFLLQNILPLFPSPVNIHWVPTLCQRWAGPWGYHNEHYFPSGYYNMLISTFVTPPEMPTSLFCVNPFLLFYYHIVQKQPSLWSSFLLTSPTNSGHSIPSRPLSLLITGGTIFILMLSKRTQPWSFFRLSS